MGQGDILEVLEKSDTPMSRAQIAEALDISNIMVSRTLQVLLKHEEIKCIELDRFQAAKLLNWEVPIRRTRFFYLEEKEDGRS